MSRHKSLVLVIVAAGLWTVATAPGAHAATIVGKITDTDGSPMEGVIVSARASEESFTTSVFTDGEGDYFFPSLDAGQYAVWAQAKGFEAGRTTVALSSATVERDFALMPLEDVHQIVKQMSGVDYLASLPQSTLEDKRMVRAFKTNCTGCHTASYPLQNRWDEHGWGILVDLMSVYPSSGVPPPAMVPTPERPGHGMILAYRDELAAYLGRTRGATELAPQLLPRPTGEATQVVITEYDLPRTDQPNHFDDGSDWSMGTPSRFIGRAAHDVWLDSQGMVWMADDMVPRRTLAKLDPRTGEVTDYAVTNHENKTIGTHSVVVDDTDRVWATAEGDFVMLDATTGELRLFERPAELTARVGGTLDVDSNGNPWATSRNGVITLDPATGRYTHYEAPAVESELVCGADCGNWGTYGVTVDRDDNPWFTQPGLDRIIKLDTRTRDMTVIYLDPLELPEVTEVDRDRRRTVRANQNGAPPHHKAPRRNAADPNADRVWTALYTADRLARIDTRTHEVTEYELPTAYASPYATAVDGHGNVWINTMNHDALTKFDPETEQFTEYRLPTLGTEIRHVQVDNRTDPPTIWAPYNRTNKVVRLQFRTAGAGAEGVTAAR
ncbi:MAG: carboxypeptidase regulatory-like domain-containing protein [Rhodospirillaceae bacterium]|nr:carboxypeptidase regulatory-like domain-containing protein [Rhodospirillaceae bacterium]